MKFNLYSINMLNPVLISTITGEQLRALPLDRHIHLPPLKLRLKQRINLKNKGGD